MAAARSGGVETVQSLLDRDANPNLVDQAGFTALSCAVRAESLDTVQLLAQVTSTALGHSLREIALFMMEVPLAAASIIERCSDNKDIMLKAIGEATTFAGIHIIFE